MLPFLASRFLASRAPVLTLPDESADSSGVRTQRGVPERRHCLPTEPGVGGFGAQRRRAGQPKVAPPAQMQTGWRGAGRRRGAVWGSLAPKCMAILSCWTVFFSNLHHSSNAEGGEGGTEWTGWTAVDSLERPSPRGSAFLGGTCQNAIARSPEAETQG